LRALVEVGGDALDAVFAHREGWPAGAGCGGGPPGCGRAVRANTVHVNTVGRGLAPGPRRTPAARRGSRSSWTLSTPTGATPTRSPSTPPCAASWPSATTFAGRPAAEAGRR